LPFSDVESTVVAGILAHPACKKVVQAKVDAAMNNSATDAIRRAYAGTWKRISEPGVVAAKEGFPLRRTLGAAIAGPGVAFKTARKFCGGSWKEEDFRKAQKRRADFLQEGQPELLSEPKRAKRSDRLDKSCPVAMAVIQESIHERTQPSPCAEATDHNFGPGNHSRSVVDGSLVCIRPDLCRKEAIRYIMGTKLDLYHECMADLQAVHNNGNNDVEVTQICRASFEKVIPFNVKEQSLRSCLCVYCYKAKLITIALHENWANLHHGQTAGAPCSCTCDFCTDGGCVEFLSNKSPKTVFSMGEVSNKLLCPMVRLYVGRDGEAAEGHRTACVLGHCVECQSRRDRFFECPRHRNGVSCPPSSSSTPPVGDASVGDAGEQAITLQWKEFTDVHGRDGRRSSRRDGRQDNGGDEDDGDWTPSGGTDKARRKKAVVQKEGTVDEFMKEFRAILAPYVVHRKQYKLQRNAFNAMISKLEEGTVMLVCDFQEKLQWGEQDEVQSQHWQKDQVTIFPCPIFFKHDGRVWAFSFQVLSNDLSQDTAWVQHVLFELFDKHIPDLLREYGALPMTLAIIFSDNCGPQFKNKGQFGFIADCRVKKRDVDGNRGEDALQVEHHYFGSGHGKNFSDSEGATTKNAAKRNIINGSWVVSDARDLCDRLARDLDFRLQTPSEQANQDFWEDKQHERGKGQLLVTKSSQDKDENEQATTFLLTKMTNSLLGRTYIFVDKDEITPAVRHSATSTARAITVRGCRKAGRITSTETPGIVVTYGVSCRR
ncbi:unnamed protein product, partial [Hapterophycus canaliculatus]